MLDVADALHFSRTFFRRHHLPDFASALPNAASLTAESRQLVEYAIRCGFFSAVAFPPFDMQMRHFAKLVEATARLATDALSDNLQYREPSLSDSWSKSANGQVVQRREQLGPRDPNPYLYLFAPEPQANCWGKTAKQIQEQFQGKSWQGLTVPEYLILQRIFAERYRDHRFFEQPETPLGHWLWLIDSMTETDCSAAMGKGGVINIQAMPIGNRDRRRAAIAGVVVPLSPS